MLSIDPQSSVPLNEQIKAGLRGLVAKGLLKPGDPAPTVRGLAASLRVNPNTVARALRELSLDGFIETRRGEASVISTAAPKAAAQGIPAVLLRFEEAVTLARRAGLGFEAMQEAMRKAKREES